MIDPGKPLVFRPATAMPAFAAMVGVAAAIWWASLHLLPPLDGMDEPQARLAFALKCIAAAGLLTLLAGVEAVAHERLVTTAFDPLAGQESRRLAVNLRYLQNTLEQFVLFAAALLVLALYAQDGSAMRSVVASTVVWVIARYVFWIGYHLGSQHRVAGLVGQAQTMLILLYDAGRFGYEYAGVMGAAVLLGMFSVTELVIVIGLRRKSVARSE